MYNGKPITQVVAHELPQKLRYRNTVFPICFSQKRIIENMLLFITEENDTLFLLVSSIYLGNILA